MVDTTIECRDYYVYVLFRLSGVPCYVGKGKGNRWFAHDNYRHSNNPNLARIIAAAAPLLLPRIKIRENLTEDEAYDLEITFIAAIGRKANGGPLVNLTDGGERRPGYKIPPEARAKISAAQKANPENAARMRRCAGNWLGRKQTAEHSNAIRIGLTGHSVSEETKIKIGNANRGRIASPEEIERRRVAMNHPDTKAKIIIARARQVCTIETRMKMSLSRIGKKFPPRSLEARENYRRAALARHARERDAKDTNPE
jgi:NUMOD3 motif-containing protein